MHGALSKDELDLRNCLVWENTGQENTEMQLKEIHVEMCEKLKQAGERIM